MLHPAKPRRKHFLVDNVYLNFSQVLFSTVDIQFIIRSLSQWHHLIPINSAPQMVPEFAPAQIFSSFNSLQLS